MRALWVPRILLRVAAILLAVLLPLWIGIGVEQAAAGVLFQSSIAIFLLVCLWTGIVLAVATRPNFRSETIASICVGFWVVLNLLLPIIGKIAIERAIPGIKGSEVALLQRESVNDAWDLPISDTMDAFYASHPELSDSPPIEGTWHWKWYYAFQQVGDETAAELASQYRQTMLERDRLTGLVAWLSPSVAIQRRLEALAETNLESSLKFEDQVRVYHEQIRRAYYPVLFREVPFSKERLAQISIPDFLEANNL